MLLQHDPDKRPTALQLSQSPLLPARVEDEYVKGALNMIGMQFSRRFATFCSDGLLQRKRTLLICQQCCPRCSPSQ